MGRIPVTPQLLLEVSAVCAATLQPAADRDWSVPAGELEWGCDETLRHCISALAFYASHLATRSRGPLPFQHVEEPNLGITELLACLEVRGAILAELALGARSDARGWHRMGLADAEGFLAMGCSELLSEADWARFSAYSFMQCNGWEYCYYEYRDGSIPQELWVGVENTLRGWIQTKPGLARF